MRRKRDMGSMFKDPDAAEIPWCGARIWLSMATGNLSAWTLASPTGCDHVTRKMGANRVNQVPLLQKGKRHMAQVGNSASPTTQGKDAFPDHHGRVSPPTDVSLSWLTEFCYALSWTPVANRSCSYTIGEKTYKKIEIPHYGFEVMQGGAMNLSLSANCGVSKSNTVFASHVYPELVRDFDCSLGPNNRTNCTWNPARHMVDLGLYYLPVNHSGNNSPCSSHKVKAQCPIHQNNSCNLKLNADEYLFLFNGTVNGTLAMNTFRRTPSENSG
ncbi:unnamed protein product [Merluccius merluccius]